MLCVVREHVGTKHAELRPDATSGALVETEVEEARRTVRCLTDAELTAVATMAKRAEKHYGCPQDVEWALDADLPDGENVLLLQSRPETVHSSASAASTAPAPTAPSTAPPSPIGFSMAGFTSSLTTGR